MAMKLCANPKLLAMVLGLWPALQLGCVEAEPMPAQTTPDPVDHDPEAEGEPLPFELSSSAFLDGEAIPLEHECGGEVIEGPGENTSPALSWTAGPEDTQSYALMMDDVDSGVVHWVVYDIPVSAFALPEDVADGYEMADPEGAKQAELQGSGYHGYLGPCSEWSVNTYRFTLHAIGTRTLRDASPDTSEYDLVPLIERRSLAWTTLAGES